MVADDALTISMLGARGSSGVNGVGKIIPTWTSVGTSWFSSGWTPRDGAETGMSGVVHWEKSGHSL